jgi:hypothetical protein
MPMLQLLYSFQGLEGVDQKKNMLFPFLSLLKAPGNQLQAAG